MRALAITEPGRTRVVDVPDPRPTVGEVLIEVKRVGYCGSDLSTFRGANPLVTYPRIPGHEVAGVVADVAAGVPGGIRAGAMVTVLPYTACGACPACRSGRSNACRQNQTLGVQRDGALTRFLRIPWQNVVWSERLGAPEHALVEPLSVGFHAVGRGRVASGDTVLVLGCGMIGLGVINAASLRGARVIAVDIDDRKLRLAERVGAIATINSGTEELHRRVLELTGGDGPGVAIEAVGTPATFRAAVEEVAFAGRVVYIGYAKEPVSYDSRLFVMKELDILGSRNATREDFDGVIGALESGRYPVSETITATVPFEKAGEALADWAGDPGRVTKLHVEI